jgi:hypothetical protein
MNKLSRILPSVQGGSGLNPAIHRLGNQIPHPPSNIL